MQNLELAEISVEVLLGHAGSLPITGIAGSLPITTWLPLLLI